MTNEELDTLIAELEADAILSHPESIRADHIYARAATALTDLRTERDAALEVINKARSIIPLPHVGQENGAALAREILEEAADATEEQAPNEPWAGATFEAHAAWLRARAASRRAEADNV